MDDKELDEMINEIKNKLKDVYDGDIDIKYLKGAETKMRMIDTFMNYPIIQLNVSRSGSDVSVSKCDINDVIDVLPNAIGMLLGLVPESKRNDILIKSITENDMSKNGGLIDRLKEKRKETK